MQDNEPVSPHALPIQSYAAQLEALSLRHAVPLKRAYLMAGVPDSTFYRGKHGTGLRYVTAAKIARAVERLAREAEAPRHGPDA